MIEDVVVEPMTEGFILWRCLHSGPLSRSTIDQWQDSPYEVSTIRGQVKARKSCALDLATLWSVTYSLDQ